MKHAFFADMGGFMFRTNDDVKFLLDGKHILWLLEHQAISVTQFERDFLQYSKLIDDKNKSDVFVRVIAVAQALWFCINIIARGVQKLTVTTLETTTIGIIVDSILAYYIWRHKPANVESIEVIEIDMAMTDIIALVEDEAARTLPYYRTPLDFVSREINSFNLINQYVMNLLKQIWPKSWQKKNTESFGQRSDSDMLPSDGWTLAIAVVSTFAFMGTNFITWNFHFPTQVEKLLWRLASSGLAIIFVLGMPTVEMLYSSRRIKSMQAKVQRRRQALERSGLTGGQTHWRARFARRLRIIGMKVRNNSPETDPSLDVSLVFLLVGVSIAVVYPFFRIYLLVEDVIAFRALPEDAYTTVNWMAFAPHVG